MKSSRRWQGFYYDGRTAGRHEVTVSLEADGVHVCFADGTEWTWLPHELRQTQGSFEKELVRLERGVEPAEALLVQEPGFAEAMAALYPGANRTLRGRRSTAQVLAWSFGAIALAVVAYVWGAPVMAAWLAPRVPPSWETAVGASAAKRLAPADRQCTDSAGLAALRSILDRLVAAGPALPYPFTLAVVRDTVVNAFAAPGGFIAVHSGLLSAARSPEEVAGVLAHEIQHVVLRHSTRAVIREAPLRLALATLGTGTGLETATSVAGTLGTLRYRRGDEAEADREGMRLLVAAEVDPSGMVTFMETLEGRYKDAPRFVSYLSSHPATSERVAGLAAVREQSHGRVRPLLDSAAWERVKGVCGTRS